MDPEPLYSHCSQWESRKKSNTVCLPASPPRIRGRMRRRGVVAAPFPLDLDAFSFCSSQLLCSYLLCSGCPHLFTTQIRRICTSIQSIKNLYAILLNSEGSTVAAPTIVQSSVLLAIGITPSKERLKQLAQTIMGPHSRNLGLNNTKFGRVKQVQLSSVLQLSLHGSGGSGSVWSHSPAPLPHPHHHHHRHHLSPVTSPAPAPALAPATITGEGATPPEVGSPAAAKNIAPGRSYQAHPPNCRQFGYRKRSTQNTANHGHLTPAVAPTFAPLYPFASPKPQVEPPAHVSQSVPFLSPLPNVAFAHAELPPKNQPAAEHSSTHFHGPSPSSSAGCIGTVRWASLMFVVLVFHV